MAKTNRLMTGAATVALAIGLALGGPASAQTAPSQEHDAHHPDGAVAPAAPTQTPPERGAPMQRMPAPGGQPGGMAGMMSGDMGRMMQMMHRRMAAQHAMRPFERIEGQLAFYRAELRITDAQQPQWNAFAETVRTAAGTLRQAVMQAMQQGDPTGGAVPAPEQMEHRIALLTAQADAMRSVQVAARPLYAALSAEQKRTADALMEENLRGMGGGMGRRGEM
jgi:hypothetical protein